MNFKHDQDPDPEVKTEDPDLDECEDNKEEEEDTSIWGPLFQPETVEQVGPLAFAFRNCTLRQDLEPYPSGAHVAEIVMDLSTSEMFLIKATGDIPIPHSLALVSFAMNNDLDLGDHGPCHQECDDDEEEDLCADETCRP